MTDPISRDAKADLLAAVLEESRVAHAKCVDETTADVWFQHGRHGGLIWAYNAIANSALANLPALDGDGRWEKLLTKLAGRIAEIKELVGKPIPGERGILECECDALADVLEWMVEIDLTSGDAAKGD